MQVLQVNMTYIRIYIYTHQKQQNDRLCNHISKNYDTYLEKNLVACFLFPLFLVDPLLWIILRRHD